jgi:hypothetical protein
MNKKIFNTDYDSWELREILEGEPKYCCMCSDNLVSYRHIVGNQAFHCNSCGWNLIDRRPKNKELHSKRESLPTW